MSIAPFNFYGSFSLNKSLEGIDVVLIGDNMPFKGVASIPQKDKEGEFLDPKGFDLSEFKWVNWVHQSSSPSEIIGEITKSRINADGTLYIEGILHANNERAKQVYELAKNLETSGNGNTLALSIEGKAIKRDGKNPKWVKESKLTAVAICPTPVNTGTWVQFMKAYNSKEQNLPKLQLDKEKAKAVFKTLFEHNIMSLENARLLKAFESLGLSQDYVTDFLFKSEMDEEEQEMYEKASRQMKSLMKGNYSKKSVLAKMISKMTDLGKGMYKSEEEGYSLSKNDMEQMYDRINKEMIDEMNDDEPDSEAEDDDDDVEKAFTFEYDESESGELLVKFFESKLSTIHKAYETKTKAIANVLLQLVAKIDNLEEQLDAFGQAPAIAKSYRGSYVGTVYDEDIIKKAQQVTTIPYLQNREKSLDIIEKALGIDIAVQVESGALHVSRLSEEQKAKILKEENVYFV